VRVATEFDSYADSYDRDLSEALAVSGEDRMFFARGRVAWLARRLREMHSTPRHILDFGCGTGASTPILLDIPGAEKILGVDTSTRSIGLASRNHGSPQVEFSSLQEYIPSEPADLAFCNGVFHHIPLAQRSESLQFVFQSVRAGGFFSFWENNPWNPGTRYVMAQCAFARDAVTLTPIEARRILRSAGFEILRTDFLFLFPRALKALRPLEPLFSPLPLGAQYHVLCQKHVSA
jgi:SAM-dependent methyltransferase